MGGDPRTPEGLNAGLAAADEQNPGQVDQICETCPDNWVETGAIDESTGEPLPNLPYRIFEIATKDEVARGVLDANGRSPRHQIPMPATQLFAMFGTDEAIDEAMEQMDALQRERAVQENARPEWRGFEAGLSQEEFNARHRELIESGTFVDEDRGFFEGAISGARGIGNLVGSLATGQGLTGWAESEYARRRDEAWDQYQLATGARVAGRGESFGAGADQSASFYFGDEISARLGSLLDERSYEEIIDDHRHILDQSRLSNPGYYMGGEIAGAVPTIFVPIGGAAASAARGGAAASMKAGGIAGAGAGAISGAGQDEGGIVDRLDGAAVGALTGGIGGAVLSGAAVLIVRGISRTRIWARVRGRNRAIPEGVSFGRNANQDYHVWRHVEDELGMSRQRVQDAIVADLPPVTNLSNGLNVRTVTVDGVKLQYNAFKLPDGTVNIGRIHEKN